jgi:hypothetical protein
MTPIPIYKFCSRIYRTESVKGRFGQIKAERRTWKAEIRTADGNLVRYAGIWKTLRDAQDEITHILNQP